MGYFFLSKMRISMVSYKLCYFIICKYEKLGYSFEGKKIEAIEAIEGRA